MNKTYLTHLVSLSLIILGYFISDHMMTIGFFAISGSVTNAMAVHMLFEKIPGLYGSGIIPARFQEFKDAIRSLIMDQFFTEIQISQFVSQKINIQPLIDQIDYDRFFNDLIKVVQSSSLSGMLDLLGGLQILEQLREPFVEKTKTSLQEFSRSKQFESAIDNGWTPREQIIKIVDKRLKELNPSMVKKIIQDMIQAHLSWLVVWGGVFGGLIGLLMSLLKMFIA